MLEGKTTAGLSCDYTAREASEKLLEGCGVSFSLTSEKAVAIMMVPTVEAESTFAAGWAKAAPNLLYNSDRPISPHAFPASAG